MFCNFMSIIKPRTLQHVRCFRALVVDKGAEKGAPATHTIIDANNFDDLPTKFKPKEGKAVTDVNVAYTTLNYKDGMVLQGLPGVAIGFPIVPGIDFVGQVEKCSKFNKGDWVVMTGHYSGQHINGGYAEKAQTYTDWLVPLPKSLKPEQAMLIGTAGFTAMQSILYLERAGKINKKSNILVNGSTGGVGSTSIAILKKLGYQNIIASTRKIEENSEFLKTLGATEIVNVIEKKRPLEKEIYDAVIDPVGGQTLGNCLPFVKYNGAIAISGVAAGPKFEATVFPFILRGVSIFGIDSVQLDMETRKQVWERLETDFPREYFDTLNVTSHGLADLENLGAKILKGQVTGRVLVDVQK